MASLFNKYNDFFFSEVEPTEMIFFLSFSPALSGKIAHTNKEACINVV